MTTWNPKANELFLKASELESAAERERYLDDACAGDVNLRAEVEALLEAAAQAGGFLESPVAASPATIDLRITEGPGTIIGQYKLLEQIGEGGFGVVFMAEQTQPVRRKVALKVLKPGMDTRQVVARFEAERQALAIMDHPNIARVFDGGATPAGRPYFVMELVKGTPITEFCDRNRLTARERLELFIPVCQAVQHAHQKGIIHRDLKPSNVLVVLHDTKPVVKVIDFGVAKALGQELTDKTLFTGFAQMIGTPLYMSPEQAGHSGLDIDTRTDIYSLGVLLYELLTGATPFDKQRFREAAYEEIRRIIREEDPPKPSTRLSASKDSLPSVAAQRHTEPEKLTQLVRGELDWIVMKALEKDRSRRYETANSFAADVQRYLNGEPVLAAPPSKTYRITKFIQRNRAAVFLSLFVVACILSILINHFIAAHGIRRERDRALVAAEQERLAKSEATEAAAKERLANERSARRLMQIELINKTLFDIFTDFDIRKVKAGPDPVESVLAQRLIDAGHKLDANAIDDPLVLANLQNRLGQTLVSLGRPKEAIEFLKAARDTRQSKLGSDDPVTLSSMNDLAIGYQFAGQLDLALPLMEETLKLRRAKFGPDHPDTLVSMHNLANGYSALGRHADALKLREETLALRKARLGSDHPDTLASHYNVGVSYYFLGRRDEAIRVFEETLALRKAKLGSDHPDTLGTMNNLANAYASVGRYGDAARLHEETLALRKAKLGTDHLDTLWTMTNLANCYHSLGRRDEALKLREETLALRKARLGPDHPDTLASMHNLAISYSSLGRAADALRLREETLALRKAKLGPDHPETLRSMENLALSYRAAGQYGDALKLHEETVRLITAKLGANHPDTLQSMNYLAWFLAHCPDVEFRNPQRAVQLAALAAAAAPKTAAHWTTLGSARYRAGDWNGAIADLEQAINLSKSDDASSANAGFFLAMAHWKLGHKDQARTWFDKSVAWSNMGNKNDADLRRIHAEAAELLGMEKEKSDEARKLPAR